MNKNIKNLMAVVAAGVSGFMAVAAEPVTFCVNDIYYQVREAGDEVEVAVPPFEVYNYPVEFLPGDDKPALVIPSSVTYDGVTYTVTGMAPSSFVKQNSIERLVLPPTMVDVVDAIHDCPELKVLDLGGASNVSTPGSDPDSPGLPKLEELLFNSERPVKLGDGSFWSLPSLKKLKFPDRFDTKNYVDEVTGVPYSIDFYNCFGQVPSLEEIRCPMSPPWTAYYLWMVDCPGFELTFPNTEGIGPFGLTSIDYENCNIYVPTGAKEAYATHLSWGPNVIETDFWQDGVSYRITGNGNASVWLPEENVASGYQYPLDPDGVLRIPGTVEHEGRVYNVSSLAPNSIVGQTGLRTLVLPAEMEEAEKTITDCPNLATIDFGGMSLLKSEVGISLPSLREMAFRTDETVFVCGGSLSNVGMLRWIQPQNIFPWESGVFTDWRNVEYLDFSMGGVPGGTWTNLSNVKEIVMYDAMTVGFFGEAFTGTSKLERLTLPKEYYYLDNLPGHENDIAFFNCFEDLSSIREIYSPAGGPPNVAYGEADDFVYTNLGGETVDFAKCTLYVPQGSKEYYAEHICWKAFTNIVEIDFSSVDAVESDSPGQVVVENGTITLSSGGKPDVFTLDGRNVEPVSLPAGVYVVRHDGGKASKVVVK